MIYEHETLIEPNKWQKSNYCPDHNFMPINRLQSKRLASIDIMRGLAVILMVIAHILYFMGFHLIKVPNVPVLSNLAAPFFLIVSGVSYDLFLISRSNRYHKQSMIIIESFSRALMLYLISIMGLFFGSILFPLTYKFDLLGWSLLQVIAFGYLFSLAFPNKLRYKLLSILVVFALSFLIGNFFYDDYQFLISGGCSLIPWIAYFLFGRAISELYINKNIDMKIAFLFFLCIFVISILLSTAQKYEFNSENRNLFSIFLTISSLESILSIILIENIDRKGSLPILLSPISSLGRIALTIYYIHIPLCYLTVELIFKFSINDSPWLIFILALIMVISCIFITEKFWKKYNYILGAEWLLRTGAKFLMNRILNLFSLRSHDE